MIQIKGGPMNDTNAKEEIRYIQEMIEQTRKITAGAWMYFLVWGVVIILAVAVMYALVSLEKFELIWVNWTAFVAVGVIFSMVYGRKHERLSGARTYPQIATAHVSMACGIGFMLAGFVFPFLELYTWGVIPVLMAMIAGTYVFSLGGIYEWNLLKWCGVIWWIGAVGSVFLHENLRALLFIPLILVGYIMPALVLRSKYNKQRENDGA
jgi:hypothetical protein